MANTDIKWFSSDDFNAPTLPANWDVLIDVIDACLVNGYGSQGFSLINISNGVAVVTFNSNHSFKQFQVIKISGASNPMLNKEFKVLGLSPTTVEFLIDLPDQTITEVMSAQLAPLGWKKSFSGIGKAVYQAKNKIKNPFYLRVDSTRDASYPASYTKFAKVGILETCSGIDDLSATQAPFSSDDPNRNWVGQSNYSGWAKWKYAIADTASADQTSTLVGNRKWFIVGNDTCFYFVIRASIGANFEIPYGFGSLDVNGSPRPFLLSNLFYDQSGNLITAISSLANPALGLVSGLYDYVNSLANTSAFRLTTGFGNAPSGATANTIKADPVGGYYLTPFYLIDPNNYILGQLPLVSSCINNASTEISGSIYKDEQEAHMLNGFRVRNSSASLIGMLFFKIYEGE